MAVDGLTFQVPAGAVCGFLGRNGAGKSTAIRMMMNLIAPSSGSATLLGLDSRRGHDALMRRVGDPELLILDEPATGLDVLVRRDFLESIIQLIQQDGRTVLFSSHLVHEVERVADHVVIVDSGRLVLSMRLDDLKAGVRRMIVRQQDPGRIPHVPGFLRSCRDGKDLVMTVQDSDAVAQTAIECGGGEVLEVTGLSLEDIFVDVVAGTREEERQ
jgi:ABC-type multidrug transport system ATPase subunit